MTTKTDCYIYSLFIPNSQDGITDGVFFFLSTGLKTMDNGVGRGRGSGVLLYRGH